MRYLKHTTLALTLTLMAAMPSLAATFVVPSDRDLIHRADAIVTGTTLPSYSQMNPIGGLETVTPIHIESVIAGTVADDVIDVVEPGGELAGRATIIAGVPRFAAGSHVMLMLAHTGERRWAVTELVLGKFSFRTEGAQTLLLRDEAEVNGWDPDLSVHRERPRAASAFIQFIRDEVAGRFPAALYFVDATNGSSASNSAFINPRPPQQRTPQLASPTFEPAVAATFSANSYTMILSGSQGGRWTVFPSGVTFYMGTTQEPGAPGGGATAIQTAFASWNNDAGSNVNYVYGGVDNGTHTQGLHAADGANTILFERDLSAWGVGAFTCTSNSYSGTLGLGGITNASGSNTLPDGETFLTTQEGDVEMNRGIANCTLLFNNGDWNSAVTHEVGHTLGFRHADQNRSSNGACSGDPTLECSSSAIMTATVTPRINAALQPWDINAVRAVYPGAGGGVPPTVTSISPTSATGYITVTITGSNFVSGAQVYIGGFTATNVRVVSSTQITATNPALSAGSLNDVTVVTSGGTATLPKAFFANFYDVPAGNPFQPSVEKVVRAGITAGCGGGNYCPNDPVNRAQMAVFLEKARHGAAYVPPSATGTVFGDVPANSFAAAYIEEIAREGITGGCGNGNFCPGGLVTRAQMSVFILVAEHGTGYTPPAATGTMFADVPANSFAAAWIEQVAREGITNGCDATHFCPGDILTRGQMAAWISVAFRL